VLAATTSAGKERMDDLYELLSEFERKLEKLRKEGNLTAQGAQLFREFAAEVERRTGTERWKSDRGGPERRSG
jgi:hypothetical protein